MYSPAGMYSPLTNFTIDSNCKRNNWFGWPCDESTETLRRAYVAAPEGDARRAALVALQEHLWEVLPVIPIGEFVQPYAARGNVTGILKSHIIVFWNIAKG